MYKVVTFWIKKAKWPKISRVFDIIKKNLVLHVVRAGLPNVFGKFIPGFKSTHFWVYF